MVSQSPQPPLSNSFVSIAGVSFSLHNRPMVSNLSLSLGQGECVSLVGPNGAGKTTLLRILCGLYRGYTGSARILGREIKNEPVESLAKLVSLVPQRMEFLPGFTVSEYMELTGPQTGPQVHDLLSDLEDRLLPELSGGELQRVIIAGAVAQGVKLLLLDEPSSNLDPSGRSQVEQILRTCRDQFGISYILVTHDISLALRCCSRMLVMANGEHRWFGDATEDTVVSELENAYGCGFVRLEHQSLQGSVVVPV
jgi:ABC-type cobalamin/Fe3+-siderophores transport system ATPase subunit